MCIEFLKQLKLETGFWKNKRWKLDAGVLNLDAGVFWNLECRIWNLSSKKSEVCNVETGHVKA